MRSLLLLSFILILSTVYAQLSPNFNKRILVISGGGARGAWGAGFANAMCDSLGTYRAVFGTSTGSLMAPLIVLNDFTALKEGYTSVTQKDIFDNNPFNTSTGQLKGFHAFWRVLTGKKTLGETHNLRKLVEKFLPEEKFNRLKDSLKGSFTVAVVDFKTGLPGFRSSDDYSYKEMVDWIWASANEPLFMTYTKKNTSYYVDGGVRENIPLKVAVEYAEKFGVDTIDVIINKPIDPIVDKTFEPKGIFKGLLRLIELWETEVRNDDLKVAQLFSYTSDLQRRQVIDTKDSPTRDINRDSASYTPRSIVFNYHFLPKDLFEKNKNELIFNKQNMQALWDEGKLLHEDHGRDVNGGSIRISLDVLKQFVK